MPHVVVIALTVDADDPEEAIGAPARRVGRVREQLAAKLPTEDQPWQSEAHHLLPRWQIASVRQVTRLDERGNAAG